MDNQPHIGFPTPLLGMSPVRLPVLFDDGECIVLAKPAGVLVQVDPWYPRLPVLVEAIAYQARHGKPEFSRLKIGPDGLWAVTDLDPECHGPVLFARSRDYAEQLRSACGSDAFDFTFTFLTKAAHPDGHAACDLPLARHQKDHRMLVSSTSGKKALTRFERLGPVGDFHLWRARTTFPRRHQVFLHALECGLPVLGDAIYARERPLLLSRLKRNYAPKGEEDERPLFPGPACYLGELAFGAGRAAACGDPPRWQALLTQLRKHARGQAGAPADF